jgi:hypothetical protein
LGFFCVKKHPALFEPTKLSADAVQAFLTAEPKSIFYPRERNRKHKRMGSSLRATPLKDKNGPSAYSKILALGQEHIPKFRIGAGKILANASTPDFSGTSDIILGYALCDFGICY